MKYVVDINWHLKDNDFTTTKSFDSRILAIKFVNYQFQQALDATIDEHPIDEEKTDFAFHMNFKDGYYIKANTACIYDMSL